MDNLGPGPCPRCHKEAKPLFNTYYCDCDEVTEKITKSNVDEDEDYSPNPYTLPSNYSTNLSIGQSIPMKTQVVINGVQMTHWLECTLCAGPVLYIDHDPLTRPGELISEANGYHQYNYVVVNGSAIVCDSCGKMVSIHNFQQRYLHKY